MKDLYKILGVAEDADDDTIKKAYRKLAKENHPDATGGDKQQDRALQGDRRGLRRPGRQAEARGVRPAPATPRSVPDGMPQGFDPDTFAQVFGGGAGGFRAAAAPGGVHVTTEFNGDLGDLFSSLFGGGVGRQPVRPGRRRRPARAAQPRARHDRRAGRHASRRRRWGPGARIRNGSGASIEVQIPPGVDTGGRLRLPGQGGAAAATGRTARRPACWRSG